MGHRRLAAFAALAALTVTGCAVESAPGGTTPVRPAPSSVAGATPAATTSAQATPASERTGDGASPTSAAPATTQAKPSPTPSVEYVLRSGAVDPLVRELQARLRQVDLFPYYDVTDTFGPVTTQGVMDYQTSIGAQPTGDVDARTWASLRSRTQAPSQQELANMVPGPVAVGAGAADTIRDIQHRLTQLTLYSGGLDGALGDPVVQAVRQFQTNQGLPVTGELDQRTWDRLSSVTRQPTPAELKGETAPMGGFTQELDPRCLTYARVVCASMSQQRVSWVLDGKAVLTLEARFGSVEYPSRPGVWHIWLKDANAKSTIFGETIPMPYSFFFDEDRAVHYSETFKRDGYLGTSHGCVNVRDYDAIKWLYSQVNIGDTVIVY